MCVDENYVPVTISVPVYYTIDDDEDISYDVDAMKAAFDEGLSLLPESKGDGIELEEENKK